MAADQVATLLEQAWKLRESEQWDRMLELAQQARALAEANGYTPGVSRALAVEAFVHYIHADMHGALAACMQALRLAGADPETESRTRGVLAMVHWSLGNYQEALENSDRSIRAAANTGGDAAFTYAIKGGILLSVGQLDEALECHKRSLEAFEYTRGDGVEKARALSGLGLVYLAQKRHTEALGALLQGLEIARRSNHRITTARALNDVGEAFEALEDDEQALKFHEEALSIRQQDGYKQAETTSLLALARIHERRCEYPKAIPFAERALEIAASLGLKPRIAQSHHTLATIYERTGQLAQALQHVLAWDKAKSELAVEEAALRYKALALEAQIEAVQRQTELESLATLGSLVAAIAHEVNTPLGAIQSSANVAALAAEKLTRGHDPKAVEVLRTNARVIGEATRRIADVVARLKVFAGIDQSAYANMNVVRAVEDTVALLRPEFDQRVEVTVEHDATPSIYAYATEMHQVFLNLLRNATQSIEGAGKVRIHITTDEQWILVSFTDTGTGIPPDLLPQIFTPTFRSGEGRVRASLSLFTCMAVVKKHAGDINVESQPGAGSTFTVRLPRSLERTDSPLEPAV